MYWTLLSFYNTIRERARTFPNSSPETNSLSLLEEIFGTFRSLRKGEIPNAGLYAAPAVENSYVPLGNLRTVYLQQIIPNSRKASKIRKGLDPQVIEDIVRQFEKRDQLLVIVHQGSPVVMISPKWAIFSDEEALANALHSYLFGVHWHYNLVCPECNEIYNVADLGSICPACGATPNLLPVKRDLFIPNMGSLEDNAEVRVKEIVVERLSEEIRRRNVLAIENAKRMLRGAYGEMLEEAKKELSEQIQILRMTGRYSFFKNWVKEGWRIDFGDGQTVKLTKLLEVKRVKTEESIARELKVPVKYLAEIQVDPSGSSYSVYLHPRTRASDTGLSTSEELITHPNASGDNKLCLGTLSRAQFSELLPKELEAIITYPAEYNGYRNFPNWLKGEEYNEIGEWENVGYGNTDHLSEQSRRAQYQLVRQRESDQDESYSESEEFESAVRETFASVLENASEGTSIGRVAAILRGLSRAAFQDEGEEAANSGDREFPEREERDVIWRV